MVSLNKKRLDFESAIVLAIALLGNLFFDFQNVSTVENGFFHQRYWSSSCLERLFNCPRLGDKTVFSYLSGGNEKLLKSRTVSQLIMPVHEPKVAYKLVQFCWKNPREYLDPLVYNQFYIT